jgi:hypothetical protein
MTRIIAPLVLALSVAAAAEAQTPAQAPPSSAATEDPIQKALLAAPANLRENATVIRWNADFTHEVLKQGTNKLVCYDRSGKPMQQVFAVECTSMANLPRVKQNMEIEAAGGGDRAKTQALLEAAEKNGTRVKPEFGSMFYNQSGPDQARMRLHMTVAVPGATTATLGLPETGAGGGVWIMNAGTSTAHLMIPGH